MTRGRRRERAASGDAVEQLLDSTEAKRTYAEHVLRGTFFDSIRDAIERQGVAQVDLAKRIGVTPGRISQMLAGPEALSFKSVADLATALEIKFEIVSTPAGHEPITIVDRPVNRTVTVSATSRRPSRSRKAASPPHRVVVDSA